MSTCARLPRRLPVGTLQRLRRRQLLRVVLLPIVNDRELEAKVFEEEEEEEEDDGIQVGRGYHGRY
jgi:hypothetical protein